MMSSPRIVVAADSELPAEAATELVIDASTETRFTFSLFPGTRALAEEARWVAANYVPKLGSHRLTLTYPVMAAARRLVFLVSGASKAEVVRRVLEGDAELPATRAAAHPNVTFLLDRDAASELKPESARSNGGDTDD